MAGIPAAAAGWIETPKRLLERTTSLGQSGLATSTQAPLMRSAYLVVMGCFFGYLADQQKRLRAEKDVATRMLGWSGWMPGLASALPEFLANYWNVWVRRALIVLARESECPNSVGILE